MYNVMLNMSYADIDIANHNSIFSFWKPIYIAEILYKNIINYLI